MASATTLTPYSQPAPISLPSIRDMFPEHLMPRAAPGSAPTPSAVPRSHFMPPTPRPPAYPSFSFDVLKSHPRGSSLHHIASSRPTRAERRPVVRTQLNNASLISGSGSRLNIGSAHRPHSSSGSSDGDAEMDDTEDGEEGEEGAGGPEGKKHVCPTCAKRFNRPSSLRIHVNTHTGATPFRCPHPSCGRSFNVNSNMRRHYRNHTTSAFTTCNPAFGSHNSGTPSPSTLSFNSKSPSAGSSLLSPPSTLSSPISPPSATWSVSSGSVSSPVTPASAAEFSAIAPTAVLLERSPISKWGTDSEKPYPNNSTPHVHAHAQREADAGAYAYREPEAGAATRYSESDVRSERPSLR
ncbi:hypothetical protein MVEN_02395400 [Mycena venus]|uniref:C2H2-type domain-containing protein n=1 Tax=Mycena venus TaxID=2733690 RepID=A0A8H6X2D8_9AGAR|nr:hypothetical protein MVEN_02395400 [Mycena venus]